MLFGTEVFINCQFTHYAGFFSAVGLFFVFYCAFKPLPTRKSVAFLLNLFGVIISILGFWIRYESFLSVLPVVFVYLLVEIFVLIRNKDFFEQIKKSSIKQIFKGFMKRTWGAFLLLALIVISVFVNYKAFYENEGWRYWKEYNALRSSVLDYQLPDYESNKAKYKVTDLRCLNETAVNCFMQILKKVCNTPDCTEVSFSTDIDENELNLIADIITSIDYEYRKDGKKSYSEKSVLLVTSYMYKAIEDKKICTFGLVKDHAKAMYDYAQGKKQIGYYDLVVAVAEHSYRKKQNFLKTGVHKNE